MAPLGSPSCGTSCRVISGLLVCVLGLAPPAAAQAWYESFDFAARGAIARIAGVNGVHRDARDRHDESRHLRDAHADVVRVGRALGHGGDLAVTLAYPPELVGARRRIVLGKHSGRSSVQAVLDEHGFEVDRPLVDSLGAYVKAAGGAVATEDLIAHAAARTVRQPYPTTLEAGS